MQHIEQLAASLLGVAERERADRAVMLEQDADGFQALVVLDLVEALANLGVLVLFKQLDLLRLAQELAGQSHDAFRKGCRKEHRLASIRALLGNVGDVVVEAHVEHAIGLVEHQRIECVELQAAAFEVVHDASRRADDDVRAVLQAVALRAQGCAAAKREDLDIGFGTGQATDFLRHLVGQFACRAQHHGLHGETARIQVGQQRQGKGRRLAAAGLGLGDQVVAGERDGQAGGLDRRHRQVFELFKRRLDARRQRQFVERATGRFGGGRRRRGGVRCFDHAQLSLSSAVRA